MEVEEKKVEVEEKNGQTVHYNGQTGKWTLLRKDGAVAFHGSKQNFEEFLDWQDNVAFEKIAAQKKRKRQARIRRRMVQLLNWLYNNKKRR